MFQLRGKYCTVLSLCLGCPWNQPSLLKCVKWNIYKVHIGKYLSDTFPTQNGPKQRDALSLLFLNFPLEYTNKMSRRTRWDWNWMRHITCWSMLVMWFCWWRCVLVIKGYDFHLTRGRCYIHLLDSKYKFCKIGYIGRKARRQIRGWRLAFLVSRLCGILKRLLRNRLNDRQSSLAFARHVIGQ
jgi:hypothetical protein